MRDTSDDMTITRGFPTPIAWVGLHYGTSAGESNFRGLCRWRMGKMSDCRPRSQMSSTSCRHTRISQRGISAGIRPNTTSSVATYALAWMSRGSSLMAARGIVCGAIWIVLAAGSSSSAAGIEARQFTVTDEIGIAHFGDPYGLAAKAIQFSPDRAYAAILMERGRPDLNRPEDTLSIYRSSEIVHFVDQVENGRAPASVWSIVRSTADAGPIITQWRWLRDSSGIVFLEAGGKGTNRLVLANVANRITETLTPAGGRVLGFDVRDRSHF